MRRWLLVLPLSLCWTLAVATDAPRLFQQHCAACHGKDRLGGTGPALVPENLSRLDPAKAARVIDKGRAATQMPAFGDRLHAGEILALAHWIFTPPGRSLAWGTDAMGASHKVFRTPAQLPSAPVFKADPLNLFVVVESGDHHVTVLDGDRFEPLARLPTHRAVHGGPKFSPDGRFVYIASRDGWIQKLDLWSLQYVAEIRAGINTRNLAVSGDGRWVLVGNYLPHTLVVLDALDLRPVRVIPVRTGGKGSRVSAVYTAYPRHAFIAALKDIPEVWEIPYGGAQPPGGGIRRIHSDVFLDDFLFDPGYRHLLAASQDGRTEVIDLDSGKGIARLQLPGMPHLASGITWDYRGRPVIATPNLKQGVVSVIDTTTWQVIKRIPTLGPGFFMRSHEDTPYAWTDVFFGPDRDAIHVIDKATLKIVKTLRPAPGRTAAHVEFTRDGRYALVSVWAMDGALVVYDARTLKEVKRLPMVKPSGKYNVYNKITRSRGTSH